MKQRLLVMNGQRIVQAEQEGAWANQKVDKAGALKPGMYNLYMAQQADKKQTAHARCATKVVWPVTYILRGADAQIANSSPTHAGLLGNHRE